MSIIIKKALLNNKIKDVHIEGNRIKEINDSINIEADYKINGNKKAIIPSFVNAHTHAAMTIFRGYGDDMNLKEWLEKNIWPNEARMNEKIVYQGARLACLEMIKSGTTLFNDMYWHYKGTAKAVKEMRMRAFLNPVFIDLFDDQKSKEEIKHNIKLFHDSKDFDEKIKFSLGPHAIYTVSEDSLKWLKEFSDKNNLKIHIHLSETEHEVKECIKKHGIRPVEYLEKIGFLSDKVVAAHSVWVNDREIDILAKRKVTVVHNPISNLKLSVNKIFPYHKLKNKGVKICLGTDGAGSNNNLSMFDTMKTASLIQKHNHNNPTILSANECFELATKNGFQSFNIDTGVIQENKLADLLLVNLKIPEMIPTHNLISNIVYSANSSCVNTTICNGKILMNNRIVNDEEKIMEESERTIKEFLG